MEINETERVYIRVQTDRMSFGSGSHFIIWVSLTVNSLSLVKSYWFMLPLGRIRADVDQHHSKASSLTGPCGPILRIYVKRKEQALGRVKTRGGSEPDSYVRIR